ncbi:MAG: hypothetical protein ABIR94_16760 [Rubrivivax sp.]
MSLRAAAAKVSFAWRAQIFPTPLPMLHRTLRTVLVTLDSSAALAAGGAAAWVSSGLYDVCADRAHFQWVDSLLDTTLRHSVGRLPAASTSGRGKPCSRACWCSAARPVFAPIAWPVMAGRGSRRARSAWRCRRCRGR